MGWQVEDQAASCGRDPGGDVDDLGAQARPARLCHVSGHCGGAGDVERGYRAGDPGGVGHVLPGRQVRQWSVLELGDDLLDDRVVTVALVGLDQPEVKLLGAT